MSKQKKDNESSRQSTELKSRTMVHFQKPVEWLMNHTTS